MILILYKVVGVEALCVDSQATPMHDDAVGLAPKDVWRLIETDSISDIYCSNWFFLIIAPSGVWFLQLNMDEFH